MKTRTVLLLLIGAAVLAGLYGCGQMQGSAGFSDMFRIKVEAVFKESVARNGFPGAVLGIMRASDGAELYLATGMSEADDTTAMDQRTWMAKTAMTTDTRFRIASVSKTFTAILILKLIDEGKIALTDTIDKYFPGLVPNSASIEIKHLLTMSSGLYDHESSPYIEDYQFKGSLTQYFSPEALIGYSNSYGGGTVKFAPGANYEYCNTNFTILAMIAEKVTGKTYDQLITEEILTPLGLTSTVAPSAADVNMPAPFAHGYQPPDSASAWRDYSVQNMSWDLGAGSIVSTAPDLIRMIRAVYNGELISAAMKTAMMTPPPITDMTGKPSLYGFGVACSADGTVGHTGANPGYNAVMIYSKGYYYAILGSAGMLSKIMTPTGEVTAVTSVSNILKDVSAAVQE